MPDDKVLAKYVLGFLHLDYGDNRIADTAWISVSHKKLVKFLKCLKLFVLNIDLRIFKN